MPKLVPKTLLGLAAVDAALQVKMCGTVNHAFFGPDSRS